MSAKFWPCLCSSIHKSSLDSPLPAPSCCLQTILCSNVPGLTGNLSDLIVVSSRYDMLLRSETLVSNMRHVSELLVSGFGSPVLIVVLGQDASGPWYDGIDTRWIWSILPTQVWVWLMRNAGFYGLWCETERICVQCLPHPRPRWSDFYCSVFTSINGCRSGYSLVQTREA